MVDSRSGVAQQTPAPVADERVSVLLGKRNVASVAVGVLASAGLLAYAANSGATLADPKPGARFYEVLIVAGALVFLTIGLVQSFRGRKLKATPASTPTPPAAPSHNP